MAMSYVVEILCKMGRCVMVIFKKEKAAFLYCATAYRDLKRPQAWHKVNRAARRLSTPRSIAAHGIDLTLFSVLFFFSYPDR